MGQILRRPEFGPINFQCIKQQSRREVAGEGEWQTELPGELRAVCTRTEQPNRHIGAYAGVSNRPAPWRGRTEIAKQVIQLAREILFDGLIAQGARGGSIGPRGAAHTEVDPSGEQAFERAKLLGDDQRGMIRQHHASRTDADGRSSSRHVADQNGRRRAGDSLHAVMLGEPEPREAPFFGVPGEIERVPIGFGNAATLADACQIKNGKSWIRHDYLDE